MNKDELLKHGILPAEYATFVDALRNRYVECHERNGYLQSPHEGYAVLLEETEEVKALVFSRRRDKEAREAMKKELIDVAQVAMAMYLELCS